MIENVIAALTCFAQGFDSRYVPKVSKEFLTGGSRQDLPIQARLPGVVFSPSSDLWVEHEFYRLARQGDSARMLETAARQILRAVLCVAFLVLAACAAQMPKNIPESITDVGPEPKVPDEFIGCWRGTLKEFDTARSLSLLVPSSSLKAMSTTYEFCFSKAPDGTGKVQLTDVDIAGSQARVLSFHNRITSVDPKLHRGSMRNHTTVESSAYLLFFPIHTTQDIYAQEDLQMTSPDVIAVNGQQTVVVGGNPVGEMTFHTKFIRVPDRRPAANSEINVTPGPARLEKGCYPMALAR